MTPVLDPEDTEAHLLSVAAWNVSLVRGAVALLAAVAARLPAWRERLGAVARSLEDPRCWAGPAAQTASASLLELSAVAAAVDEAIGESLVFLQRMAGEAETAQQLAVLAVRSGFPTDPGRALWSSADGPHPLVGPAPGAVAASALEHAAAALRAARAAAESVGRLAPTGGRASETFGALTAATVSAGPVLLPSVPVHGDAGEAAAWWATLSVGQQLAVLRSQPAAVGELDGLPAWARDRANRMLLARALRDPATPPEAARTAEVISGRIAAEEARGQQVQLQLLDLTGDRVVLALGDLDTADAIALLVPGMGNTPEDDLGSLTGDAVDIGSAARAAAPGMEVATVVWLGYRTPGLIGMASRAAATTGGAALAAGLTGLSAARSAAGTPQPRTTVLAHSYGTVVVDEAADVAGDLPADAVVLLGSPGMEGDARSLEVPEVYDAAAPADPVAAFGYYGNTVDGETFGATELPVDFWSGHSGYYDPDRPTLAAMGEVVAGVRAD